MRTGEAMASDDTARFAQVARTYDRLAPDYDQAHVHLSGDAWVRSAFHQFVEGLVPPGATLLDFGCGTGTDALHFASRGFRVQAYDPSEGMVAVLRRKCAAELQSGQVDAWVCPFGDFAASAPSRPRPQAIVANFAVVNSFRSLTPLFEAWRARLAPGGLVAFSSLNPLHWKLGRRPGFWLHLARDWHKEAVLHEGAHRHWTGAAQAAAAQAGFLPAAQASVGTLIRYSAGRNHWHDARSLGERAERRGWRGWPLRSLGLFQFHAFRLHA